MKNIILVFVLLFTTSLVSLSQHTFETLISNPADQIIDGLLEDDDGNLLFVGRSITEGQPNSFSDYLFKLDKAGNILYENFDLVSDTVSSYMSNIFYINENYYLIGALNNLTLLSFTKLDKNLQLLNYKTFPILEKRWFSYMNSMVDSDTNFVVTGYITKYDTVGGNVYLNWDAFFYKISLLGDSISSRFYTNDANRWYFSFDILESADKSKYYAYVSHFVDSSLGYDSQRLSLDKNFDSITIDLIPLRIYDPNSPLYINETDVLISGKGMGKDFLYHHVIATHNEAGEIINYNKFKKGSYREHPPMKNAISKFGDNIYVGGNSNFDFSNPFWSGQKSWFHLVKVEPDLSVIWEKWFGGDAYYLYPPGELHLAGISK